MYACVCVWMCACIYAYVHVCAHITDAKFHEKYIGLERYSINTSVRNKSWFLMWLTTNVIHCVDNNFTAHVSRFQKETFTHSHPSWSSINLYLLPLTTRMHSILPVQFSCLTVFLQNLSPSPLSSTFWSGTLHFILHTFIHPIIDFFSQHMTIQ